jgi:hypothetical protein
MRKITKVLGSLAMVLGLASCGVNGSCNGDGACEGGSGSIDLDSINKYLSKDPYWANMNANGNKVTLIPFTHINGPKVEWEFFGVVNFEYDYDFGYKYQVTYLSCTCRTSDVNYWQTAFVDLSTPMSGNADDIVLKNISFDVDDTGHYLGGFWGDSGVHGYDINGSGMTYEGIRDGFLPYLEGKTYGELKNLSTYDDINKEEFNAWALEKELKITRLSTTEKGEDGKPLPLDPEQVNYDMYIGSSVSTNNIIRIVNALMAYHAANNI